MSYILHITYFGKLIATESFSSDAEAEAFFHEIYGNHAANAFDFYIVWQNAA